MKRLLVTVQLMLLFVTAHAQISFNYHNVKASEVVYSISKLTETTIVAPEINTYVSLQASDVSRQDALDILKAQLRTMKYDMCKEGKIYVVRQFDVDYQANPNPKIIDQELVLRTYHLRCADAKNMAQVIKDITVNAAQQRNQALFNNFWLNGKEGETVLGEVPPTVSYEDYNNCLVVRGTQSQIDEIKRLLVILDADRGVVWANKVYRLKHADAKSIAPIVTHAFMYIVNGQYQMIVSTYIAGNMLVVTCPQQYVMDCDNLVTCLDAATIRQDNATTFKVWNGSVIDIATLLRKVTGG